MRDPGLVQRAEQAALALERAWEYWRGQRGLGAENATPVSSYVGYSLEEPWGQPRVVFGLGADEAEMLAAVIIGHDYIGPVHADLTDWPRAAGNQSAPPAAPQLASEDRVAAPGQARSAAESDRPADKSVEPVQVGDPAEQAEPVIAAMGPREQPDAVPAAVVAVEELVPLPAAETDAGPYDRSSPGPAYRGPRYQGIPPQYQSEGDRSSSEEAVSDAGGAGLAGDQPDRATPLVASRASRPRRSQRGGRETKTWGLEQEHQPTAADRVV